MNVNNPVEDFFPSSDLLGQNLWTLIGIRATLRMEAGPCYLIIQGVRAGSRPGSMGQPPIERPPRYLFPTSKSSSGWRNINMFHA